MKKLFFSAVMLVLAFTANAQADVTKFLGIPVDGTKEEMIAKLKEKGFRMANYNPDNNILEGEFNGYDVNIHIATNKNKVYRIMVGDKNTQSGDGIKNRFNILCEQFKNNPNYLSLGGDCKIPENEDIRKEMLINKKEYQAIFYQQPDTLKSEWYKSEMSKYIFTLYTPEQLAKMNEEEKSNLFSNIMYHFLGKKAVWFRISEFNGEYYIAMYYDNGYNKANGEDL